LTVKAFDDDVTKTKTCVIEYWSIWNHLSHDRSSAANHPFAAAAI